MLSKVNPSTGKNIKRFVLLLLFIEFLDELVCGAHAAAWPLIKQDLHLNYSQIGLLIGLPMVIGNIVESFLGIMGDVWKRRFLVLGGGVFFVLAFFLTAVSYNFYLLLFSFILFYPSSGAFVGLSEATLMDLDTKRHEHNMARWVLAGSLGVVFGPLVLNGAVFLDLGWRGLYIVFAMLTVVVLVFAWKAPYPSRSGKFELKHLKDGFLNVWAALKKWSVTRWLVLLLFSDLMLDVFLGLIALYFVDVAKASPAKAALAVTVWSGVGLLGDALLIPLLEKVDGLKYLRFSSACTFIIFVAFLLISDFWIKIVLLGLLGLLNSGWFSILAAKLYSSMPNQSGTVTTVNNVSGLIAGLIPMGLGLVAQKYGLNITMWLLALGPVALLIGIPYNKPSKQLSL
jgi:FSR family fosmidomycin resistance protein-like MFS transporter